jgi:hypothetical protein
MRKFLLSILFLSLIVPAWANDTIPIPLTMSVFPYLPMDKPDGSTPDPTDPNQFRASLTGNTLLIRTQQDAVSYVVVQETASEQAGQDYFYDLSYGTVACPITRTGDYTIRIGCWKTDFVGHFQVTRITLADLNGRLWGTSLESLNLLPAGYYVLQVETNIGTTMTKFFKRL